MRRAQLEEVLVAAARVAGKNELVVIGSQAVHAVTDAAPAEVLVSLECDVLFEEGDEAGDAIRRELGPASAFRSEHGFYVDAVPPGLPVLPGGWRARLQTIDAQGVLARCLEVHDLAVAKLAAGRLKDYELTAALLDRRLISAEAIRERIATFPEDRLRAVLLARLQIVLESLGGRE